MSHVSEPIERFKSKKLSGIITLVFEEGTIVEYSESINRGATDPKALAAAREIYDLLQPNDGGCTTLEIIDREINDVAEIIERAMRRKTK